MPVYTLVRSRGFDGTMMLVIIGNVFILACDYHGIEDDAAFHTAWTLCAEAFFYVYWAEFLLKLWALGPAGYFESSARVFGDRWTGRGGDSTRGRPLPLAPPTRAP